jgi:hypothetical protein
MSGMNHRTWQLDRVGHFVTTIQLDAIADDPTAKNHAELADVTRRLIDLLDQHRLPATWAVNDPAQSAATSRILRSSVPHEVAILGDANWFGPSAGRTRFARELSRRVEQARAAGLRVQSLVPRVAAVVQNVDLVVKHDIRAIAGGDASTFAPPNCCSPRSVHYGVWEVPFSSRLPGRSSWFFSEGRATWRRIRVAAKSGAIFNLLIDAPLLCDEGRTALKTIAWLMDRVATLRDREHVHVETLQATALRLSAVPATKPQRSILRHAA